MKRNHVVLASVVVGFAAFTAGAQPGMMPAPGFDGAIAKLFGDNTAFSASMEFHYTIPPGEVFVPSTDCGTPVSVKRHYAGGEGMMPGQVAMLDGKSRFDMDFSNAQGEGSPAQAPAFMKGTRMDKTITIARHDKKLSYEIYPDMKAYTEEATQETNGTPADYKAESTVLGEETIDGHDCIKNKVVVTGPDGVKHESTVWNATDLKKFPVKIQTTDEKGVAGVMLFKDVKLDRPDAAQFDPPADFTKYNDLMNLLLVEGAKSTPPHGNELPSFLH
jgi:hypothetical protein